MFFHKDKLFADYIQPNGVYHGPTRWSTYVDLRDTNIVSLGNLEEVGALNGGNLPNFKCLGNLKRSTGTKDHMFINLCGSGVRDLSGLEKVSWSLHLEIGKVYILPKDLGALTNISYWNAAHEYWFRYKEYIKIANEVNAVPLSQLPLFIAYLQPGGVSELWGMTKDKRDLYLTLVGMRFKGLAIV